MKRLVFRSTAAVAAALAIAAVGSPLSAQTATQRSGYMMAWGKTAPAPAAPAGTTERAASGYMMAWGRSGYMMGWGRSGYMMGWGKSQVD